VRAANAGARRFSARRARAFPLKTPRVAAAPRQVEIMKLLEENELLVRCLA
jgi:hypothetical protein